MVASAWSACNPISTSPVSVHAYAPPIPQMTRYELTAGGLVKLATEGPAAW